MNNFCLYLFILFHNLILSPNGCFYTYHWSISLRLLVDGLLWKPIKITISPGRLQKFSQVMANMKLTGILCAYSYIYYGAHLTLNLTCLSRRRKPLYQWQSYVQNTLWLLVDVTRTDTFSNTFVVTVLVFQIIKALILWYQSIG